MPDGRVKNGGRRSGTGRKPKIVESAEHSVLLEIFDAEAERQVVAAQIRIAVTGGMGSTAAATWLWDRKYGKVKDQVEQSGDIIIRVKYDENTEPHAS